MVSFENLVKNCQLDLVEQAECIIDYQDGEEAIQAIEVAGQVQIKALLPGDSPKLQVKLALPDVYDELAVHHLCIRPKPKSSKVLDKNL